MIPQLRNVCFLAKPCTSTAHDDRPLHCTFGMVFIQQTGHLLPLLDLQLQGTDQVIHEGPAKHKHHERSVSSQSVTARPSEESFPIPLHPAQLDHSCRSHATHTLIKRNQQKTSQHDIGIPFLLTETFSCQLTFVRRYDEFN